MVYYIITREIRIYLHEETEVTTDIRIHLREGGECVVDNHSDAIVKKALPEHEEVKALVDAELLEDVEDGDGVHSADQRREDQ